MNILTKILSAFVTSSPSVDFLDTPEGQLMEYVDEIVSDTLEGSHADVKRRKIIWKGGAKLGIQEIAIRIKSKSIDEEHNVPTEMIVISILEWIENEGVSIDGKTDVQVEKVGSQIESWIDNLRIGRSLNMGTIRSMRWGREAEK